MKIKIHGNMFTPTNGGPYVNTWRVYGSRKALKYSDGKETVMPGTWEFVTEFELKKSRGKMGFPTLELEPTGEGGLLFYKLVPLKPDGEEIWHKDDEPLTLPASLPEEFEPPFDFGTWVLWNLERVGDIAPGQLRD